MRASGLIHPSRVKMATSDPPHLGTAMVEPSTTGFTTRTTLLPTLAPTPCAEGGITRGSENLVTVVKLQMGTTRK